MKIILGSQSQGRQQILREMGYEFEVMTADIDEKAIRFEDPKELVLALASAKADELQKRISEPALLITGDQVVVCDDEIREKPRDAAEARKFLQSYAQHPAEIVNAIAVTNTQTGKRLTEVDTSKIYLKPLPEDVIEKLILQGDVFTQAGGFSVRNPLIEPLVERIDGTIDSVEGLPRELTERLLKEAEV